MDPVITNIDNNQVLQGDNEFRNDTLTAAGALTIADGTLLGRITASGKLGVYDSGAATGLEIPVAVYSGDDRIIAGAGDVPIRAMVSGKVSKTRLIEQGKAAGVDITEVVVDQLRNYSIIPVDVTELNILDNQ